MQLKRNSWYQNFSSLVWTTMIRLAIMSVNTYTSIDRITVTIIVTKVWRITLRFGATTCTAIAVLTIILSTNPDAVITWKTWFATRPLFGRLFWTCTLIAVSARIRSSYKYTFRVVAALSVAWSIVWIQISWWILTRLHSSSTMYPRVSIVAW